VLPSAGSLRPNFLTLQGLNSVEHQSPKQMARGKVVVENASDARGQEHRERRRGWLSKELSKDIDGLVRGRDSGAEFDIDNAENSVVTLYCY
jgi:hypothetical protein